MSTFTLDAGGARDAGSGLGNLFKAFMLAPQMRQQAADEAALQSAQTYSANMRGNKDGAEAHGLALTNRARSAPIDTTMPGYLQQAMRLFQATGDANVERIANAGTAVQTQGFRDKAAENVENLDVLNRWNTLAKPGETYEPYKDVGTTGTALHQATGQKIVANEALRRLFGDKVASEVAEKRAQASNASASAKLTQEKLAHLLENGSLPGSGREASEGALSSTILRTLQVPALDGKGRQIRNPITGEQETTTDQAALAQFYTWATENKRKPTATAFAQWEAQGRPGNKSPAPAPDGQKITPRFKSAEEVKADYAAGKLSREQARAILQSDFGMK